MPAGLLCAGGINAERAALFKRLPGDVEQVCDARPFHGGEQQRGGVQDRGEAEGRSGEVRDDAEGAAKGGPKSGAAALAQAQRKGVDDAGAGSDDHHERGDEELEGDHGHTFCPIGGGYAGGQGNVKGVIGKGGGGVRALKCARSAVRTMLPLALLQTGSSSTELEVTRLGLQMVGNSRPDRKLPSGNCVRKWHFPVLHFFDR